MYMYVIYITYMYMIYIYIYICTCIYIYIYIYIHNMCISYIMCDRWVDGYIARSACDMYDSRGQFSQLQVSRFQSEGLKSQSRGSLHNQSAPQKYKSSQGLGPLFPAERRENWPRGTCRCAARTMMFISKHNYVPQYMGSISVTTTPKPKSIIHNQDTFISKDT